ncbi:MAG: hypothetical protein SVJ22_05050 [Halobacteriota archaeon]|nr:hypothetical protein [Halobacteriota archaeon]
MTNGNNMHKSLLFLFSTTLILLVVLSSGCTIPEERSFYVYGINIGTEGNAQNITLIVPMPYYKGEVYSEIVTDPKNSEDIGDDNTSYDIVDTKYGNMLRIQSPRNGSIKFFRDADHSPINDTPWISGEDPVLYPRFNQTPLALDRKTGEAYDTMIYASFDGGAKSSLKITARLSGHTMFASHRGYSDRVNRVTILHNESGEWIRVEGEVYS